MPRRRFDKVVNEQSTFKYTGTLKDSDGNAIGSASLSSATLTLYEEDSGKIVNNRDGQNVLNANNVTISSAGVVTWSGQANDTKIIGNTPVGEVEKHIALFKFVSGSEQLHWEVEIPVRNLGRVLT